MENCKDCKSHGQKMMEEMINSKPHPDAHSTKMMEEMSNQKHHPDSDSKKMMDKNKK